MNKKQLLGFVIGLASIFVSQTYAHRLGEIQLASVRVERRSHSNQWQKSPSRSNQYNRKTTHYCPGGYVNIGDSIQAVQSVCGQPVSMKHRKVDAANQGSANPSDSDWVYDGTSQTPNNTLSRARQFHGYTTTAKQYSGSHVVFTISNGSVSGISVNGQAVQQTTACTKSNANSKRIRIGNGQSRVQMVCGQPTQVLPKGSANQQQKQTKQTLLTYKTGSYSSSIRFVFQNNRLISIE